MDKLLRSSAVIKNEKNWLSCNVPKPAASSAGGKVKSASLYCWYSESWFLSPWKRYFRFLEEEQEEGNLQHVRKRTYLLTDQDWRVQVMLSCNGFCLYLLVLWEKIMEWLRLKGPQGSSSSSPAGRVANHYIRAASKSCIGRFSPQKSLCNMTRGLL